MGSLLIKRNQKEKKKQSTIIRHSLASTQDRRGDTQYFNMCLQDMCVALPNHASKCNFMLNIYMLANETVFWTPKESQG